MFQTALPSIGCSQKNIEHVSIADESKRRGIVGDDFFLCTTFCFLERVANRGVAQVARKNRGARRNATSLRRGKAMERLKRGAKWLVRQRWWWPLVSLCLLAVLLRWTKASENRDIRDPQYLKALKALPAQGTVDLDDFELHTGAIPPFPERFVNDQSLDRLRETRYRRAVEPGELLRWEDLEDARPRREIPPGHRAYAILPDNPWLARGGDRIDILVRPQRPGGEPVVLAESVLVLERLGRGTKGEVVVALRQRDLELLEKAKQQGKLSIAVLGKADFASDRPHSSRRHRRQSRRVRSVEIITGAE